MIVLSVAWFEICHVGTFYIHVHGVCSLLKNVMWPIHFHAYISTVDSTAITPHLHIQLSQLPFTLTFTAICVIQKEDTFKMELLGSISYRVVNRIYDCFQFIYFITTLWMNFQHDNLWATYINLSKTFEINCQCLL